MDRWLIVFSRRAWPMALMIALCACAPPVWRASNGVVYEKVHDAVAASAAADLRCVEPTQVHAVDVYNDPYAGPLQVVEACGERLTYVAECCGGGRCKLIARVPITSPDHVQECRPSPPVSFSARPAPK